MSISESPESCARAPGINARSRDAPPDDRTVSPSWILLFRVNGWKSFCCAFPKRTLPLTESTVADVAGVMLFEQPFARSEQIAIETAITQCRISGPCNLREPTRP